MINLIAGLGEVIWGPQLPRARGARQQTRRDAIQGRTQECMTAVINEGIAPCGGPGGSSIAKGSRRKAATPEGRESRADSRMPVMNEGTPPCGGPGGASIAKGSRRKAATRRAAIQECMTAVMTEGVAPCGGPGGASNAKGSRRKAAAPEDRGSRADSRTHDSGHD